MAQKFENENFISGNYNEKATCSIRYSNSYQLWTSNVLNINGCNKNIPLKPFCLIKEPDIRGYADGNSISAKSDTSNHHAFNSC